MQRLSQEGLGWVPTCCNLVALLCFGLCLALNWKVRADGPAWELECSVRGLCEPTNCVPSSMQSLCALIELYHPAKPPTPSSIRCCPDQVTGGNPAAILLLAPLLLLLAQDPLLLRALEERRRYAPPVAVVTLYLTAAAGWQLVEDVAVS